MSLQWRVLTSLLLLLPSKIHRETCANARALDFMIWISMVVPHDCHVFFCCAKVSVREIDAWCEIFASLWLQWHQLVVVLAAASTSPFARRKAFLCSLTPSSETYFCGRLCSTAVAEVYASDAIAAETTQIQKCAQWCSCIDSLITTIVIVLPFHHFLLFYLDYRLGQLPQLPYIYAISINMLCYIRN